MDKVAVFPGSFDPFTVGHESIVKRSLTMFDKVIIAIGQNSSKNCFFSLEARRKMIEKVFEAYPQVTVDLYDGLTVEYCKKNNSQFLLRGLRTAADFEYERAIGQINKMLEVGVETVFLLTAPEHTPINSTIVRDVIKHKGDVSSFIPSEIIIEEYLNDCK